MGSPGRTVGVLVSLTSRLNYETDSPCILDFLRVYHNKDNISESHNSMTHFKSLYSIPKHPLHSITSLQTQKKPTSNIIYHAL